MAMQFSGADSRLAPCQENFTGKRASSTFRGKGMPLLTGNHIKKRCDLKMTVAKSKHVRPEETLVVVLFSLHLVKWMHATSPLLALSLNEPQTCQWLHSCFQVPLQSSWNSWIWKFSNNCHIIPACEMSFLHIWPVPPRSSSGVTFKSHRMI